MVDKGKLEIMQNLQKKIFAADKELQVMSHEKRMHWLATALIGESVEVLNATRFRHWKDELPDAKKLVKEEIIDILHYFLDLTIEMGMGPEEIINMYEEKACKNILRFQIGKKEADEVFKNEEKKKEWIKKLIN